MGAKQKLNTAYIIGAIMFAAAVGITLQSWLAFVMILAFSIYAATKTGQIR